MNNLGSLRSLIKKLSGEEMKVLLRILQPQKESKSKSENKSFLLVNLLLVEPSLSSNEIQKNIYGSLNYSAFNKLCSRLREKALDSVLMDSSIESCGYSKRNEIVFELKKKLIQADILNLKGLREQADAICKKIIVVSSEYEIYDLIIQSLITREKFVRIRKNKKELSKIINDIKATNDKYESFRLCQSEFNSIMNKIATAGNEMSYFDELKKAIGALEIEFTQYNSNSTGYFLQLLKTQLYQNINDFKKADESLDVAMKMLKKKSVYSDNRMGSVLLSKAENYIKLRNFEGSVLSSEEASNYFPNNIFNKALVFEYKFYANFFSGEIKKSKNNLEYLCNLPEENNIILSINKWKFLSAALMFIENKFNDCLNCLQQISEIDKDKEGWNVNIRILSILCRIELNETDSVDLNVQNLEKFLKRISKTSNVPSRYQIILRILVSLLNEGYDFSRVSIKKRKYLTTLEEINEKSSWKIKGPELIPFHVWFKNKVNNSGPLYNNIISSI